MSTRGPMDERPDDALDAAIRDLLSRELAAEPPMGLLETVVARARETVQLGPERRTAKRWGGTLLAVAMLAVIGGIGLLLGAPGSTQPTPTSGSPLPTSASGSPMATPTSGSTQPTQVSRPHFSGSGVSFDYPATWHLEPSAPANTSWFPLVAAFGRNLPDCPSASAAASPSPAGLTGICPFNLPLTNDSMAVFVGLALGVGAMPTPNATVAGRPAERFQATAQPTAGDQEVEWTVVLPGRERDSLVIMAQMRGPDLATLQTELDQVISSLQLSPLATPRASYAPTAPRYAGGIPETVDGEPVYLGLAAVVHALDTTDATTFLIGGWFTEGTRYTCSGGVGLTPGTSSPLLQGCATVVGGDGPWGLNGFPGPQGRMYWNGLHLPDGVGPSVLRVHTHDHLAASCGPTIKAACEQVLVVDQVLWTGDATTQAAPLSVQDGVDRLTRIPLDRGPQFVSSWPVLTAPLAPCGDPWPAATFVVRGDPGLGLFAVFPDTASRQRFQAATDPGALAGCPLDPRIARPGAGRWVGYENALALVFGTDAATAAQAALAATAPTNGPGPSLAQLPATFDQSYETVADFEAERLSGALDSAYEIGPTVYGSYDAYDADVYRRFAANALSFTISDGRPVTASDVPAATWSLIQKSGGADTARLFTVTHPASTDPGLATEVFVALRRVDSVMVQWLLIPVPAK